MLMSANLARQTATARENIKVDVELGLIEKAVKEACDDGKMETTVCTQSHLAEGTIRTLSTLGYQLRDGGEDRDGVSYTVSWKD